MIFDQNKAQQIWQTVCKVPKGKVASYGQIADLAGLPGRARLVGKVLAYAPNKMNLPWFRIIKSNGQLAFIDGSKEAETQRTLLQKEGVNVMKARVKLNEFAWKPSLNEILSMKY